ncbi:nuclear transport factor 2 family protein [Paucibacter sp. XJ19-41]|uniref:nuclear transport factor 2 family protein n=1 Tax=Paucibacter sp. XJ19-41 TaxID=2927824 RepID=UPI00234AC6C2|nr:nuclear transport factor 2 family protein [Paucibacter sp. XJ19-41]MDC6169615.1 nuclear transport factor 2 family protein [Paucibacter sp. XJ19-41]
MTALILPEPIAAYFAADQQQPDAVARCFTAQAVVKDEGRSHAGLDAIRAWKAGASTKYTYTSEPFAREQKDGRHIVTSRVAGNFPGSPVDLRYDFRLEGGLIASLEIRA